MDGICRPREDDVPAQKSRLACRDCAVICERVVYPAHCLRGGCRYVYVFTQEEYTYFGCMQKVFSAELDLALHLRSPRADGYGALLTCREPLPECLTAIERAYGSRYKRRDCPNPLFRHDHREFSPDAVRCLVLGPERRRRGPARPS